MTLRCRCTFGWNVTWRCWYIFDWDMTWRSLWMCLWKMTLMLSYVWNTLILMLTVSGRRKIAGFHDNVDCLFPVCIVTVSRHYNVTPQDKSNCCLIRQFGPQLFSFYHSTWHWCIVRSWIDWCGVIPCGWCFWCNERAKVATVSIKLILNNHFVGFMVII